MSGATDWLLIHYILQIWPPATFILKKWRNAKRFDATNDYFVGTAKNYDLESRKKLENLR